MLIGGLGVAAAGVASQLGPRNPARLAIYYGFPSLVNGAGGDVERAVRAFANYDVLVLGDGLQYAVAPPGRPGAGALEHGLTRAIVRGLAAARPTLRVFGYVPLGDTQALSIAALADGVRRWQAMGVHGVFLDEAGYDFGVTRTRQSEVIDAARAAGLRVFVNAFNPDDVLSAEAAPVNARGGGNPLGMPSKLQAGDLLLLESFVVRNGQVEPPDTWFDRSRKAAAHSRRTGIGVMTVTTTRADRPFDGSLCQMAWWGTVLWGFEGFGWGEPDFAAPSSVLPLRACEDRTLLSSAGSYVSDVARDGSRFERRSDRGVVEVDFGLRRGGVRAGAALRPLAGRARLSPASKPGGTTPHTYHDGTGGTGPV